MTSLNTHLRANLSSRPSYIRSGSMLETLFYLSRQRCCLHVQPLRFQLMNLERTQHNRTWRDWIGTRGSPGAPCHAYDESCQMLLKRTHSQVSPEATEIGFPNGRVEIGVLIHFPAKSDMRLGLRVSGIEY